MTSGRDIGDRDRHFVETRIEDRAHKDTRVKRHRFARFEIDFRAGIVLGILEEFDQFLALVIGAGYVMPAAHIDPFEVPEPRLDRVEHLVPGGMQRFEILLAQIVEMDAVDLRHDFGRDLVDREAEAAARR